MSHNQTQDSQSWFEKINASHPDIKDMLSYFQEGWDARGIDDSDKLKERVIANLVSTLTYSQEVAQNLTHNDIKPTSIFVKIDNVRSQHVLVSVPIEKYLSDDFLNIYKTSSKIEKESRSENYCVSFNFTFDDGNLDHDVIVSDGYKLVFPIQK